jgi:hypothetical protein
METRLGERAGQNYMFRHPISLFSLTHAQAPVLIVLALTEQMIWALALECASWPIIHTFPIR